MCHFHFFPPILNAFVYLIWVYHTWVFAHGVPFCFEIILAKELSRKKMLTQSATIRYMYIGKILEL